MDDKSKKGSKIEGEGSYTGTRDYNEATAKFLKKGKVDEAAQEARRALDSKEAAARRGGAEAHFHRLRPGFMTLDGQRREKGGAGKEVSARWHGMISGHRCNEGPRP